jgi:hypothetical protein
MECGQRSPRLHGYPPRSFQRRRRGGRRFPDAWAGPEVDSGRQKMYLEDLEQSTKAPQNVPKPGTPKRGAKARSAVLLLTPLTVSVPPMVPLSLHHRPRRPCGRRWRQLLYTQTLRGPVCLRCITYCVPGQQHQQGIFIYLLRAHSRSPHHNQTTLLVFEPVS